MKKEMDIVALGELLIDFTEAGTGADGMKLFEQNPGGAPVNMLTAVTKNGYQTAFLGKVGDDMHGRFLRDTAKDIRTADVGAMAVVIGSEGQGVRQEILDEAENALIIPMNPHCESLNAAVAATAVMWQMGKF